MKITKKPLETLLVRIKKRLEHCGISFLGFTVLILTFQMW